MPSSTQTHTPSHCDSPRYYLITNISQNTLLASPTEHEIDLHAESWKLPYSIDDSDLMFDGKPLNMLYEENKWMAEHVTYFGEETVRRSRKDDVSISMRDSMMMMVLMSLNRIPEVEADRARSARDTSVPFWEKNGHMTYRAEPRSPPGSVGQNQNLALRAGRLASIRSDEKMRRPVGNSAPATPQRHHRLSTPISTSGMTNIETEGKKDLKTTSEIYVHLRRIDV